MSAIQVLQLTRVQKKRKKKRTLRKEIEPSVRMTPPFIQMFLCRRSCEIDTPNEEEVAGQHTRKRS